MSNSKKYSEKLRDPRWQKKRLEILQRDEFTCQSCYETENTLHVHHLKYFNGCEPWEIDNNFLITLCEGCHEWEGENCKAAINELVDLLKSKGFNSHEFISLKKAFSNIQRSWVKYEPNFDILQNAIDDDNIWGIAEDAFFSKLKHNRNNIKPNQTNG